MNKKRIYIISSTLLLIGLFSGVVQYMGMFDILYAAASNPGHLWSEMECSTAFCIDTSNSRVGIGTKNPEEALEINGNIKVNGNVASNRPVEADDLTTKGYVDEKIAEVAGIVTGAQPLVYGAHSQAECTTAEGEVVDSDVSYKMCRFNTQTCPSGWTAYKKFRTVGVDFSLNPTTAMVRFLEPCVNQNRADCRINGGQIPMSYTCQCTIVYSAIAWGDNSYRCGVCSCACSNCGTCNTFAMETADANTQIGCY